MSVAIPLQQLTDQLDELEHEAAAAISDAASSAELEDLRLQLLGKKGKLSMVLGSMGRLPPAERPLVGQRANLLKREMQALMTQRLTVMRSAVMAEKLQHERLDVSVPSRFLLAGHRHPLISTVEEILDPKTAAMKRFDNHVKL